LSQADEGILTIAVSGGTVRYSRYNHDGSFLTSRDIIFTNLIDVLPTATSISIIRANDIDWADTLELMVRLGDAAFIISEANTSITIEVGVQSFSPLGSGVNILASGMWYGVLVLAGQSGKVASFDGTAWKYPDGTGSGTGPYNDGTAMGSANINCLGFCQKGTAIGGGSLIVAGDSGRVASFVAGAWTAYNASGTGVSILANNGTVIPGNITCMTTDGIVPICFAGASGNMGSFSGSAWTNYSSVSGYAANGSSGTTNLIGTNQIKAIARQGGSRIVVAGVGGRVGTNSGGTWTKYNDAGTGVSIFANNGTVIGANDINAIVVSGSVTAFGGNTGLVGSWNGSAWTNYSAAGTGVSVLANNGTVIGAGNILCAALIDGKMVFAGASGRLGHWDTASSTWKNYNSAGLGFYGVASSQSIVSLTVYSTSEIVASAALGVNYINATSGPGPYYIGTGSSFEVALFQGMATDGYAYTYRYGNGWYLLAPVNNTANKIYLLNPTTKASFTGYGRYAIPQTSGGKTRHIITETPRRTATSVYIQSLVGYTSFGSFNSTSQVYPTATITNDAIIQSQIGFGYADVVIGNGTSRYGYLTPSPAGVANQFDIWANGTNTTVGMYGKLTNNYDLPDPKLEIRVGWINGVQGFLSAAVIDSGNVDALGVLLTAPGEFDETWTPDVASFGVGNRARVILYRYNGVFHSILLDIAENDTLIQRVSDTLYKVNTISPANLYNSQTGQLAIDSCDYNGRMIFQSSATPAATATTCASKFYSNLSNGIDVGEKLVYITGLGSSQISIPGCRLPLINADVKNYGIDTYIAGVYSFTTMGNMAEQVQDAKTNTLYLADTTLPLPIGMTYAGGAAQYNNETIILDSGRDTYTIGNDLPGSYDIFQLFGQIFLADQTKIYLAEMQGGVLTGKTLVAPKVGLRFIAIAPTAAYFHSSFDNSIYTFTGGRSLDKFMRLCSKPPILSGLYSELENTLALFTANTILWIRDGVVTENDNPDTNVAAYNTAQGIRFYAGAHGGYQVLYEPSLTSTVIPLTLKTGYYGAERNTRTIIREFVATIYSSTSENLTVTIELDSFDQDKWYIQSEVVNVVGTDYSSAGYTRVRIVPKYPRALGFSYSIYIPKHMVLVEVSAVYDLEVKASIVKTV
jgi:hypothetical protein